MRHVLDFIVIVKDDAVKTGHAEVFVQHVAGENVGSGQLFQAIAIIDDGLGFLFGRGFLHEQVQRF